MSLPVPGGALEVAGACLRMIDEDGPYYLGCSAYVPPEIRSRRAAATAAAVADIQAIQLKLRLRRERRPGRP